MHEIDIITQVGAIIASIIAVWKAYQANKALNLEAKRFISEKEKIEADATEAISAATLSLLEPLRQQIELQRQEIIMLRNELTEKERHVQEQDRKIRELEQRLNQQERRIRELKSGIEILSEQIKELGHTPRYRPPDDGEKT